MDRIYELPYARVPHPAYGQARNPAWEMIRFSVNIMRGCFGGCTFCSITEHEGRIIQNRSEDSIIREVEMIRDTSPHAVIVTTTDCFHADYVVGALDLGCDAISEKPLATEADQCQGILEA